VPGCLNHPNRIMSASKCQWMLYRQKPWFLLVNICSRKWKKERKYKRSIKLIFWKYSVFHEALVMMTWW
jgi:hypothetical protein